MESSEILLTISEVAVALAGFGGIVAGLGYRSRGVWSKQDRFRLITMEATSLAIVFACLVPYSFERLGFDDYWQISGLLLLLIPMANLIAQFRIVGIGLSAGFNPYLTVSIMLSNLAGLALAMVLVSGLIDHDGMFGFYLAAVLFVLIEPTLLFVRLLITSFTEKEG